MVKKCMVFIITILFVSCEQKNEQGICDENKKVLEMSIKYIEKLQDMEHFFLINEWPITDSGDYVGESYIERINNVKQFRDESINTLRSDIDLQEQLHEIAEKMGVYVIDYYRDDYLSYTNELMETKCFLEGKMAIYLMYGRAYESILYDVNM